MKVEVSDPVSIFADALLMKITQKTSTELLEIELDTGDFIVLAIKDQKLKAQVSSALVTIDALTESSPFCKYFYHHPGSQLKVWWSTYFTKETCWEVRKEK